ncbi:protein-L-isoaspartate O-methyltransferase, partial [Candidatus Endoriftia persephone str. Guaymas]|nr:protein-L-isoaspartate O-methyltransferase [Candidatus Endoriftia persephone str. Guaymas]
VLPVGERYAAQELVLLEKDDQGAVSQSSLLPVAFVPLTSGH